MNLQVHWGRLTIRVMAADPERLLRRIMQQADLYDVECLSPIEVSFKINLKDYKKIKFFMDAGKIQYKVEKIEGIFHYLLILKEYPMILIIALMVLLCSIWMSEHVLFVQVRGVDERLFHHIIAVAEEAGLKPGASRKKIRSEVIKNRLIEKTPQLLWVGVNTEGCIATINGKERSDEIQEEKETYGNIIASQDGVVTDVTVTKGSAVCTVGQAVKKGEILISGFTDLEHSVRAEQADGVIYAQTLHHKKGVIVNKIMKISEENKKYKRFSLLIGKKRINFYLDSGILYPGCGKMTVVHQLMLPGGWKLPICILEQVIVKRSIMPDLHAPNYAEKLLTAGITEYLTMNLAAGQIENRDFQMISDESITKITGTFRCREMIGMHHVGFIIEGDD